MKTNPFQQKTIAVQHGTTTVAMTISKSSASHYWLHFWWKKKHWGLFLLLFLTLCIRSIGQDYRSKEESSATNVVRTVMNDPDLNKKTEVSANHEGLENKIMKLLYTGKKDVIEKTFDEKGFVGVYFDNRNNKQVSTNKLEAQRLLNDIINELPRWVSLNPTTITEEFYFGDVQRIETWNYSNINGEKVLLRILFINDQLLLIDYRPD